ncbi:hypothetical protein ATANTOWER_021762, partial [Ataeniobius toweri]|nr:hypothetical protein [Ataeniobius toweri]
LGNKFFVILSGQTNGAHQSVVKQRRDYGQTEVDSFEACYYLLVFCPIASRVGTDIHEALSKISATTPQSELCSAHHLMTALHGAQEVCWRVISEHWGEVGGWDVGVTPLALKGEAEYQAQKP